jgi:hypothetical protein
MRRPKSLNYTNAIVTTKEEVDLLSGAKALGMSAR